MNWNNLWSTLVALAALTAVSCTSLPTTQYYALSTIAADAAAAASDTVLAIGPIDLPEYLQRPQIVTRPTGNRLVVDEFNRWGGALEEEIDRVLAQLMSRLVGTQRVYSYPSRIVPDIDYRISLNIRGFDGALGDDATLEVYWSIIEEKSAQVVRTNQGRYRAKARDGSYAAYAVALSDTLHQLAGDLATDLNAAINQ